MARQTTDHTRNLIIIAKKKTYIRQYSQKPKSNEECFNYRKKRHYAWDCHLRTLKKKLGDDKVIEEAKQA